MSSSLSKHVPTLDGSNYPVWAEPLQAYLMSQGQWYVCTDMPPLPPDTSSSDAERSEYKSWRDDDSRAMGNISLCCNPSIRQHLKGLTTAKAYWEKLKEQFGKPGLAAIFADLKAALEVTIPATSNPQPAIQKMNEHFNRLAGHEVKLPDFVHGMLLAMKAPAYAEFVVQLVSQVDTVDEVSPHGIGQAIVNAWEQRQGRRKETPHASRVTAIKRKPGDPTFRQQQSQQQRPQGQQQRDAYVKTKRGKRGGKAQRERTNDHAHFASAATASVALSEPRPSLASRIEGIRDIAPSGSQYPRLKRAMELGKSLGVRNTAERLRTLEQVVDDMESAPPSKRAKSVSDDERVEWASTSVDADAEDAVSLAGDSDYEDNALKATSSRDVEMQ
ncbi:hypothetical protein PsYK624_147830 [Phanerochaete sordida]|uniref:DUF4219 domain-containing protein n=1 Tax=Phanerochaete sordida TaxID=48140 RepID=A0A9P3GPM0_9APHY|nr:hypothetical protein PsYK624_147830 [Phanerochaete sordida]